MWKSFRDEGEKKSRQVTAERGDDTRSCLTSAAAIYRPARSNPNKGNLLIGTVEAYPSGRGDASNGDVGRRLFGFSCLVTVSS